MEQNSKAQDNPTVETEIIGTVIDGDPASPFMGSLTNLEIPGFRIIAMLGRGGMGCVYLAEHLRLGRQVALKIVLNGATASKKMLSRFYDESRAVAAVSHPGVSQVFEVGEANGQPFLAMEYIKGETLSEAIRQQLPSTAEATRYVRDIAQAIEACHQAGILHRDLKPANVMLTEDQTIKVMDFGLAKRLESQEGSHTRTGEIVGTPSYMAPEQASGIVKQFTPATDVYAIGAILYECLTGRPPFQTPDAMQTVMMVLTEDPVSPRKLQPKVPVDLETICLKCLQKKPLKRYASAKELADDMDRFLSNEPIHARKTPLWEQTWKWGRRHPTYTTLATMLFLTVLGAAVGTSFHVNRLQVELNRSERLFADSQELGSWLVNEHIPDTARLRGGGEQQSQLVDRTLQHLRELEQDIAADERLAQYIAQAYLRIAEVQSDPFFATHPRLEQALASYQNSLRIFTETKAFSKGNSEDLRLRPLEVLIEMARLNHQLGEDGQSLQLIYEARTQLKSKATESPLAELLNLSLTELETTIAYAQGKITPLVATTNYRDAYRLCIPLEGKLPDVTKLDQLMARLLMTETQSLVPVESGDEETGLLMIGDSLDEVTASDKTDHQTLWMVARAQAILANLFRQAGNQQASDRALAAAIEKQQRLLSEFPESASLVQTLLGMLAQKIEFELARPDLEAAFTATQRRLTIAEEQYISSPAEFQDDYLRSLRLLSGVQQRRLRFDEAQAAIQISIDLLRDSPDKSQQLLLARELKAHAELMVQAIEVRSIDPERIKVLQRAIEILQESLSIYEKYEEATDSEPDSPYWKTIAKLHEYEEDLEQSLLLSRERSRSLRDLLLPQLIGPSEENGPQPK